MVPLLSSWPLWPHPHVSNNNADSTFHKLLTIKTYASTFKLTLTGNQKYQWRKRGISKFSLFLPHGIFQEFYPSCTLQLFIHFNGLCHTRSRNPRNHSFWSAQPNFLHLHVPRQARSILKKIDNKKDGNVVSFSFHTNLPTANVKLYESRLDLIHGLIVHCIRRY